MSDLVFFDKLPEKHSVRVTKLGTPVAARVRISWYRLKHNTSAAIGQWAIDNVAVASDPSNVCHAPPHIMFLNMLRCIQRVRT